MMTCFHARMARALRAEMKNAPTKAWRERMEKDLEYAEAHARTSTPRTEN